jgi:hypothetical protein
VKPIRPMILVWLLCLLACESAAPSISPIESEPVSPVSMESEIILMTAELAAETTRLAFILQRPDGSLVNDAQVELEIFKVMNETATLKQQGTAEYRTIDIVESHIHSDGEIHDHVTSPGIYVMDGVDFDSSGIWGIRAEISNGNDSNPTTMDANVLVVQRSSTPSLGSLAPRTQHKKDIDVADLSELSSSVDPNPSLYERTIAEALDIERPFVVIFSAPAFCQSRICGPILEISIGMIPVYGNKVTFIHLEPYDLGALRTNGRFVMSDAAQEWGLQSEPFVFVIDSTGHVSAKFEGIFTKTELAKALEAVIPVNPPS